MLEKKQFSSKQAEDDTANIFSDSILSVIEALNPSKTDSTYKKHKIAYSKPIEDEKTKSRFWFSDIDISFYYDVKKR